MSVSWSLGLALVLLTAASGEVLAASPIRISGKAFICPETLADRASLSLDVLAAPTPTGSLQYYCAKTRMNLRSTSISSVSVHGSTATVTGSGTLNGASGYRFEAVVMDGEPDRFGITILKPDDSLYYSISATAVGGSKDMLHDRLGQDALRGHVFLQLFYRLLAQSQRPVKAP